MTQSTQDQGTSLLDHLHQAQDLVEESHPHAFRGWETLATVVSQDNATLWCLAEQPDKDRFMVHQVRVTGNQPTPGNLVVTNGHIFDERTHPGRFRRLLVAIGHMVAASGHDDHPPSKSLGIGLLAFLQGLSVTDGTDPKDLMNYYAHRTKNTPDDAWDRFGQDR